MSTLHITLNETASRKLNEMSQQTGRTPDELANEAVAQFVKNENAEEQQKFQEWRTAMLGIAGMWKDRDDLPDFEQLRKSWDRGLWRE